MLHLFLSAFLLSSPLMVDDPLPPLPQSIYDATVTTPDGQPFSMNNFQNKVLLIVNIADNDGNASQLGDLQDLYDKYSNQGLMVLGFPSDDFTPNNQSLVDTIRDVYQGKYHVAFPIFSTVHVLGPNKSPLYTFLTSSKTDPTYGREVDWNFNKFLVDRQGNVVGRFNTKTTTKDPEFIKQLEKVLKQ